MNILKTIFLRNSSTNSETCIKTCKIEIDNEHLTYCDKLNEGQDYRCLHILNGSFEEKIEILTQIKENENRRNKDRVDPDIQ